MRLVVTGASGQLGCWIAELVLGAAAPADLILTDPHSQSARVVRRVVQPGVAVRHADFAAPETLLRHSRAVSFTVLPSARLTDLERRIVQHQNALDAAKAAGVRHVIYTSGLKPAPPNPAVVAPSHHATEQALVRQRPRLDRAAQQPLRRLPASRSRGCQMLALADNRGGGRGARGPRGSRGPLLPQCCSPAGTTWPCLRGHRR